jgi:hypothetical protein
MRILGTGLARTAAILGPLALAAAGAVADEATPLRVNGEIASVQDRQVTVQTRDGKAVRVDLAADAKVMAMAPGRAESLAEKSVVGAAAVPQPDGRMKALMIIVYPADPGTTGEGYLSWDLAADSQMVQGEVKSVESGADGQVVQIYYPQAGATLIVPPGTPFMTLELADASILKQGAHIVIPNAEQAAGGGDTLTAALIAVGKDGYTPPM